MWDYPFLFLTFAKNLKHTKAYIIEMKSLLIAIMFCLPIAVLAQSEWDELEYEAPASKSKSKSKSVSETHNPDQKYLVGAVPLVDGRVLFEKEISAPGKSAAQVFSIVEAYMTKMTTQKNQFEQSHITLRDTLKTTVNGAYQEWLVFKNKPLELDRTRFLYNLSAECHDGKVILRLGHIYYLYDEERVPTTYKAEEWITDEYGLKKNKQKLSRVTGKFRRKTIDRKDYIFGKIEELLNQ